MLRLVVIIFGFSMVGAHAEDTPSTVMFCVDRLLDMMRTSVNVSGDLCISCIVANSENRIDETIFKS